MARPLPLQSSFQRGMVQDLPRGDLPADSAWNMVDWIPDLGEHLRKRGGWTHALSAVGGTYVAQVGYANFLTGDKIVVVNNSGVMYTAAASAGVTTAASAASAVPVGKQTPYVHQNKLIVPGDGSTYPKYLDGATGAVNSLTATGLYFTAAAVYHDMSVYNNPSGVTSPNYIFFSDVSDPTVVDTTNAWLTFSTRVRAFAPLPGALLCFMDEFTARIRGSIPPGSGSDMIVDEPIFNVGCSDPGSVIVSGSYCIFANALGVYRTNGGGLPEDLTASCGVKKYWNDLLGGYSASTWRIAGGLYRNRYFVSITNGASFVDAFCFDPQQRTAWRLSNLPGLNFSNGIATQEELYVALRSAARVAKLSTIYVPSGTVKADADGTVIAPLLETSYYPAPVSYGRNRQAGDPLPSKKTWKAVYTDYELTDAATDDPTLTISYLKDPDGGYTAVTPTLAENTQTVYARRPLRFSSPGVAFKIQQTNASADTKVKMLAADVHLREESRV